MTFARMLSGLFVATALMTAPMPAAEAFGPGKPTKQQTAEAKLLKEFERFATLSDGTVGVAVRRLSDGETIMLNGNTLFPMASTYKVAIAGTILSQIDAGTLTLETMLPVEFGGLVSSDGIADVMLHPGMTLSVYNLLELMLTRSDNSATDILMRQAGGPAAINVWLASVGVKDQHVDGNTAQLIYRAMGITPGSGSYRQNVDAALEADPGLRERDAKDLPNIVFAEDPRDTSTPQAMIDLLTKIGMGQALKPASTQILLDIMSRCKTGEKRLKAFLPPNTRIVHKTGSMNGIGNDVGLVALPDGSTFAVAVFVNKDTKGAENRNRIMAEAARAAYDYFLFSKKT